MNVPKLRFKEFDGEWEEKKIGDFFDHLSTGSTPSRTNPDYFKGEIPWISSGELKSHYISDTKEHVSELAVKETNLKIHPPGTFFIAITGLEAKGTRSSAAINTVPMTTNQSCLAFKPNDLIDLNFLYFWYKKNGERIGITYTQGTKQQSLTPGLVRDLDITVPKIEEQKYISRFFNIVEKKIELQQQKIDLLQEQKKGYMQKIFDNNKSDTSGEKWERINLNEIFLIIDGDRGKNYPSEEEFLEHGHTLFLDTKNVTKKGFKFNTKKFISEEKCKKMNNGLLMRNDLVLTSRGTIGNLALYDDSVPFNSVRINSAMLILRLVKPDISLMFLYHLLKSKVLIDFIRSSSVGSAQPHITKKDLKSLKVTFPSSLVSQEKIARFLSLIDESVKFEEEKLGLLLKQKQGFMQQMFI